MNKFIFHIFILQCCSLLPISNTFAGNFADNITGYLITKGPGIIKDSKISLNPYDNDKDIEPTNEISISVIPGLPDEVATEKILSKKCPANEIREISDWYGNGGIIGIFNAKKKECIKENYYVLVGNKNIATLWADQDAYISSENWIGLTMDTSPDLKACLLLPKIIIEQAVEIFGSSK